jgi:hypothetical protein
MIKHEYTDLNDFVRDLNLGTALAKKQGMSKILKLFKTDVTENVPIKTGDLRRSINQKVTQESSSVIGRTLWETPYAGKVYKWNVTGIADWDTKTWEAERNKYKELLIKEFKSM